MVALPNLPLSLVESIVCWRSPPLPSVVYIRINPITEIGSMVHLTGSTRVEVDEDLVIALCHKRIAAGEILGTALGKVVAPRRPLPVIASKAC